MSEILTTFYDKEDAQSELRESLTNTQVTGVEGKVGLKRKRKGILEEFH